MAASLDPAETPVVILCGGRGTRLREHTHAIPKALVEVGPHPIVWHVIRIYAAQGFRRFLLLTGYLGEAIEEFVAASRWPEGVSVECVDTGLDTPTGGRIAKASSRLRAGTFCLTYADGLADIDLDALRNFHDASESIATMTVVRPYNQWGVAIIDDRGRITGFREKPRMQDWINGGFMVLEPEALEYVDENSILEREPLERIAGADGLAAYRHEGFWDCMDTYKDAVVLNDLWASGEAPWRTWSTAEDTAGATRRA